ncbi:MAG: hypothetical protein ACPG4Z_00625 [Chitinophagales bacterium]
MKKGLAIFIFIFCFAISYGQNEYDNDSPDTEEEEEFVGFDKKKKDKEKNNLNKRLRLGADFGYFYIDKFELGFAITPILSYQIVEDRLELGTGLNYRILKDRINKDAFHLLGNKSYMRAYIWNGIFAQFSGEINGLVGKSSRLYSLSNNKNVFFGGGYSIEMGNNGYFNIGAEINLIEYENSDRKRSISPFFNFQFAF